jgi:hypothetical protein
MESRIRYTALVPLLVGLAASLSSAPVLNVETLRDGASANFHKQMVRNDLIHGPWCIQLKGGLQSTVGQSRRAKKRRYWRKPSSAADVSGAASDDHGKADEVQAPRIKRDRKAVADGVQVYVHACVCMRDVYLSTGFHRRPLSSLSRRAISATTSDTLAV